MFAIFKLAKHLEEKSKEYWGKGYSWVSISDMKLRIITTTKEEITESAIKECGCKLIPEGTILMSFKLSIGKLAFAGKDLYTNEAIVGLEIKDKKVLHPDYLLYVLKNIPLIGSNNAAMGATLNKESLKILQLPIPEKLSDQLHIANLLSKAENLISQRKQSMALLDEFLKSTFLEMFGDPVRNEKGWALKKLKDVCIRITDGTHFSPPIIENGIPYITAKHVRENKIDFFGKPWFISEQDHKDIYKRCDPKRGDVLYIKDGATTGYAAINKYDFEFSMLSSLALLKTNSTECNSEYLCSWLNNPVVKSKILLGMSGGAIQRLTLTKINALPILVPPIALQNQFAQITEKTEALKAYYQGSLQVLENLYGSLSQRAFRGELSLNQLGEGVLMAAEPETGYQANIIK